VLHFSRCSQIVAVVALGLSLMCAGAQAQVFSAPKNVSSNSDSSFTPQVAVDAGGSIYVVWEDDIALGSNVLFSRSADGGVTFSTPKNLSNSSGYSFSPRIAVDARGGINVLWLNNTPGYYAVFFSRSADGGATFSGPNNLSNGPADTGNPEIAVDAGGNISVVWENDDITFGVFYTHSTDAGATFSTPVNLATNTTGSFSPQLAADGNGDIYVVWEDDFNFQSDISFSRSVDQGATFSAPKNLSSNAGSSVSAQLAVDSSGNVSVIWADNTPGTFNTLFTRSTDKGATFSSPKNVSNSPGSSTSPQISLDAGGNIYAVWQGNIPPSFSRDIFFTRSADGGATFAAPLNLANAFGSTPFPCLNVDAGGNINVSWRDTNLGNPQIFFTQSTDRGATFSATQNLSNDGGFASDVQMAADSQGNLDVVWSDDTPGVNQIFFSHYSNPKKANQPPVANAGPDQTVACTGRGCALITLDGSKSSDPDGDTLSFVWTDESKNLVGSSAVAQFAVPLGAHTFTLTVTDSAGLSSTAVTRVTVRDTDPPTLRVSLSPNVLQPRENKLVLVNATVNVSDVCDPNPTVKLVSITSNDPADRGRHSSNDIQAGGGGPVPFGTDVRSFLLRAEHSEHGKDLVYTITYSAMDASGNTTTATAQVRVGHYSSGTSRNGSREEDEHREKRQTQSER
jgi:PKD domain